MPNDNPTLTILRLSRMLEHRCAGEVSVPQYRVLGLLAGGEVRASQLAARLAVAKPTMTSVVDGLVERGYVARDAAVGDRRVVRVSITPDGRAALSAAEQELTAILDDVVDRCVDREAVFLALDDLRKALDARLAERATPQTQGSAR